MIDARSRITVVGDRTRVDVAVPSAAPIGEYCADLARMCGIDQAGALPPVWSLAVTGTPPLPPHTCLADHRIADGQVLYLRDIGNDPFVDTTIADAGELIADEADRQRRRTRPRQQALIVFALIWLTATVMWTALHHPVTALSTAAVLVVVGLLLIGSGWALSQRRLPLSAGLHLALLLASVPALAVAGAILAVAAAGPYYWWAGGIAGANTAILMCLAAVPDVIVTVCAIELGATLVCGVILAGLHANHLDVAASTTVIVVMTLDLSKYVAAALSTWSQRPTLVGAPMERLATQLLAGASRLTTILLAGPALAAAFALGDLARSRNGFAAALAGTATVVLLVRAARAGFTGEFLLLASAGLVGAFELLIPAIRLLTRSEVSTTMLLSAAGLIGLGVAIAWTLRGTGSPAEADLPENFPAGAGRSERRRGVDRLALICTIITGPLALGVFGVLNALVGIGRGMFG